MHPSERLLLSSANRVTPIQGPDSDLLSPAIDSRIISDGYFMKFQCSFSSASGHQCNSEVSKNRPSEHLDSFMEQHESDIRNLPSCCSNVVELRHLDLDLGLLFLLKTVVEIVA